ncbi:hypothetical protein [Streptomyces sp. NPDC057426]|uniref:hypothetical protein n=1 Tax=Streptomyces sp. NPDC057426 TaxID=3346128 RepID=UPI00367F9F62
MTRPSMRHVAATTLTCCLALALTACGGGREYTVPEAACGVPLGEKALEPFLVDGEKIEVVGDSLVESGTGTQGTCELRVDGKEMVHLRVHKVDKIYDPMADLDAFRFTNRAKMEALPFSGLGALGDRNSMVSTECASPKADYLVLHTVVRSPAEDDVAERRKDIEAFTLDFVPKVKKALGCTA